MKSVGPLDLETLKGRLKRAQQAATELQETGHKGGGPSATNARVSPIQRAQILLERDAARRRLRAQISEQIEKGLKP